MSLLKRIGGSEGVNQQPYIPPTPAQPTTDAASPPAPPANPEGGIRARTAAAAPPSEELVRRAPTAPQRDGYMDLKERVQTRLIAELDPKMDLTRVSEVRRQVEEI